MYMQGWLVGSHEDKLDIHTWSLHTSSGCVLSYGAAGASIKRWAKDVRLPVLKISAGAEVGTLLLPSFCVVLGGRLVQPRLALELDRYKTALKFLVSGGIVHAFSPNIWWQRQTDLSEIEDSLVYKSEFQDSYGCTEKPRLEK